MVAGRHLLVGLFAIAAWGQTTQKVFYFAHVVTPQNFQVARLNAATPQDLQETVNTIRTQTQMQRVFPFPEQMAIAMRGTADQLARARQAIHSR